MSIPYKLQIVLPVYNERDIIEKIIRDFYREINHCLPLEFIICEDGSTDGTKELLLRLKEEIPIQLIISESRKGYARAVIDGLRSASAEFILTCDSDGQYVASDFWSLYEKKDTSDVIIGWRVKRVDALHRKVMSGLFKLLHKILFGLPIHDPSCPFVLSKKKAIDLIIDKLGVFKEGFWWEFTARVKHAGLVMTEVPVQHKERHGATRVYQLRRIPSIGWHHVIGLFKIRFFP